MDAQGRGKGIRVIACVIEISFSTSVGLFYFRMDFMIWSNTPRSAKYVF